MNTTSTRIHEDGAQRYTYGRRTMLRPGAEAHYEAAHASIPPELSARFRRAGISEWRIYRDGSSLFHLIVCDKPLDDALQCVGQLPPSVREWVAVIDSLGEPEGSVDLGLVWSLQDDRGLLDIAVDGASGQDAPVGDKSG